MVARSAAIPLALAIALTTGCASSPERSNVDLRSAKVVASASDEPIVPPGAPGKGTAAVAGAAAGVAVGVALGVLPCLAMGPFAVACISALGPAIAVTSAGTAVVAAAYSDTAEDMAAKRELLRAALPLPKEAHARLGTDLTSAIGASLGLQAAAASAPVAPGAQRNGSPRWEIRVAVKSVDSAEPGADVPFALGIAAQAEVRDLSSPVVSDPSEYLRPAEAALAREKGIEAVKPARGALYHVRTDTRLTLAQWSADGGAPVRAAVDAAFKQIALSMASDLIYGDFSKRARSSPNAPAAAPTEFVDPTGVRRWSQTGKLPGAR